jgi:hypothetical protein
MRKTRKHGKKKQVKIKHNSKRIGGGGPRESEAAVPYLIGERLNATSLRSHNQTFREPGLVSQVLKGVPRESVTLALKNADYKKEVAHLLSKKFKQSVNSRAIASKIVNAIPTSHLTIGRKKQTLLKELKIAQDALDAHIVKSQQIHARKEQLFNELGDLEEERDELVKVIGHSKLDKYDDLKKKYDELNRSQSMLKRSRASLIGIRLQTLRYGPNSKLYALIDKIEKLYQIYTKAYEAHIAAHDEEDRLFLIVYNLKEELEDLEDL